MSKKKQTVKASPSKSFFVTMLTRDIELKDAILDLLDNCVDGILRQLHGQAIRPNRPYEGFQAKITANATEFAIEDNCGGIPKDIAQSSAFRLGRADLERDRDLPTVGMYGIGMKRAIFKMGQNALVVSRHQGESYQVEIPSKWLGDDKSWNLELKDLLLDDLQSDGTKISVTQLYPAIADQFQRTTFKADLIKEIGSLFAIIIGKGFEVKVNEETVTPADLGIMFPTNIDDPDAIPPYAFHARYEKVDIALAVGFYRQLASVDEIEDELDVPRTRDYAGWTVICNDRVVLSHDKSSTTGWGLGNVPNYHNQFRAIAGVVSFSSIESLKLPLTTTKRGLDTNSPVYFYALDRMMEGVKKFTDFTNKWKSRESETIPSFRKMVRRNISQIVDAIPQGKWGNVRGGSPDAESEKRFTPSLPMPSQNDSKRRISFYRNTEDIRTVAEYLFDDAEIDSSDVGARCFDIALDNARKSK